MSTHDVPGNKPEHRDSLAMGCWGEHEDGTMMLVESTEGGRIIYSVFDLAKDPVLEYRDAMADGAFKKQYSWAPGEKDKDRWTWHDKTPFPWDQIIKGGARDGVRYADVEDHLTEADRIRRKRGKLAEDDGYTDTAAQRIRRAREITEEHSVDPHEVEARVERVMGKAADSIIKRVQQAIKGLKPGK